MERVALICDRYSFDELKSWVKEGGISVEKDGIHVLLLKDDLMYVIWNNNVCYVGEGDFLIKTPVRGTNVSQVCSVESIHRIMLIHRKKDNRYTHDIAKVAKSEKEDDYFFKLQIEVNPDDTIHLDMTDEEARALQQKLNQTYDTTRQTEE